MLASVRDANATAAARRRQRRLRSWLRHERMTVAMTLAEMAHHTAPRGPKMARVGEEVVQDVHEALRGQKTPPPGKRPAALRESGPQLVAEHAGCPCSCLPSLATPSLADATADVVDSSSLRFLAVSALEARRKEEEQEELAAERARRMTETEQLLAVPRALRTPEQKRRIDEICAESLASRYTQLARRKRKKRRKRRLPRSSVPRGGRARRRQRQRRVFGSPGFDVPRAVFPSLVVRPRFPHSGRYGSEGHLQSVGHSCYAWRDVYPQCKLCRRPSFLQVLFLDSASAWHWWYWLRFVTQP